MKIKHNPNTCSDLFCEKKACVPTLKTTRKMLRELKNSMQ